MGFWVGLRARDFPTERVLSRTALIIRTVDQKTHTLPSCGLFYFLGQRTVISLRCIRER